MSTPVPTNQTTGPSASRDVAIATDLGRQSANSVPHAPDFILLYQFSRRLPIDSFMAGFYNTQNYGYDLAISESPRPFITLLFGVQADSINGPDVEYPIPSGAHPGPIAPCSVRGGAFCFAESGAIGVISSAGVITEIPTPTTGAVIGGIAEDPTTGDAWFTEPFAGKIGKLGPTAIREYPTGISGSQITGITYAYGIDSSSTLNGFTFTDPGTNSVGSFSLTSDPSIAPTLAELPVPTVNSAPTVVGGLYFAEANFSRYGYFGQTCCRSVTDFPSDGVITSIANGNNAQWALTKDNHFEEIAVPYGGEPPGPLLSTRVPGYTNLRALVWLGNPTESGVGIFLAGDSAGAAIVQAF